MPCSRRQRPIHSASQPLLGFTGVTARLANQISQAPTSLKKCGQVLFPGAPLDGCRTAVLLRLSYSQRAP